MRQVTRQPKSVFVVRWWWLAELGDCCSWYWKFIDDMRIVQEGQSPTDQRRKMKTKGGGGGGVVGNSEWRFNLDELDGKDRKKVFYLPRRARIVSCAIHWRDKRTTQAQGSGRKKLTNVTLLCLSWFQVPRFSLSVTSLFLPPPYCKDECSCKHIGQWQPFIHPFNGRRKRHLQLKGYNRSVIADTIINLNVVRKRAWAEMVREREGGFQRQA
jgi:hypothetical protein